MLLKQIAKSISQVPQLLLLLIIIATLGYSLGFDFSNFAYDETNFDEILQAPNLTHLLGTDALGRDLFIRVIHGARMSLSIAFLTAVIAFWVGVSYGAISGYCSSQTSKLAQSIDTLMMRLVDAIYSLPDLLVLSLIALFVSRSTSGIIIGLAFISWMDIARITRTEVKRLQAQEFTQAAQVIGLNPLQILAHHLVPNAMGSIIVALSFTIPRAIIAESTLSFIGLGLSPPDTSWGTLAGDAWKYLRTDPHLIFFPALMIFITVYTFNAFGDQLRDKFSPKAIGEHLLA